MADARISVYGPSRRVTSCPWPYHEEVEHFKEPAGEKREPMIPIRDALIGIKLVEGIYSLSMNQYDIGFVLSSLALVKIAGAVPHVLSLQNRR